MWLFKEGTLTVVRHRGAQLHVLEVELLPPAGELDLDRISGGGEGEQRAVGPEADLHRAEGEARPGEGEG